MNHLGLTYKELLNNTELLLTILIITFLVVLCIFVLKLADIDLPEFTAKQALTTVCVLASFLVMINGIRFAQIPFDNYAIDAYMVFGRRGAMHPYDWDVETLCVRGSGTYYMAVSPGFARYVWIEGIDDYPYRYIPNNLWDTSYDGGLNGYYLYTLEVSDSVKEFYIHDTSHISGDDRVYTVKVLQGS